MNSVRGHIAVLLATISVLVTACGELRQQAAEPSAADETSVIAHDTVTPPPATAAAAPKPTETLAVEPTVAPPTAVPTPVPNRPEALSLAPGELARAFADAGAATSRCFARTI